MLAAAGKCLIELNAAQLTVLHLRVSTEICGRVDNVILHQITCREYASEALPFMGMSSQDSRHVKISILQGSGHKRMKPHARSYFLQDIDTTLPQVPSPTELMALPRSRQAI